MDKFVKTMAVFSTGVTFGIAASAVVVFKVVTKPGKIRSAFVKIVADTVTDAMYAK